MRIEHVRDKGVGRVNEDQLLIGNNLFGVFDGATSLVGFVDESGRTGGQIASEIAKETFENSNPADSLNELIQRASRTIRKQYSIHGIDINEADALWSANGVAVVRLSGDSYEFVQLGDGMIFAFNTNGGFEIHTIDQMRPSDSEVYRRWVEGIGKGLCTVKDLQAYALPVAKVNRYRANTTVEGGYGAINGQHVPDELIQYGKRSLRNVALLALVTDGLGVPTEDPLNYVDWNKTAEIIRDRRVNGLLRYVRELEESDPECLKYPRFKKSDDATGITIHF